MLQQPLFYALNERHRYETFIYECYCKNGGFTLTESQREAAFGIYKAARVSTQAAFFHFSQPHNDCISTSVVCAIKSPTISQNSSSVSFMRKARVIWAQIWATS